MDQLRADALLDLLDGTYIDVTPGPRRGVVELIVGLETLAGLDEQPRDLNGFGPVAADIARQCAAANLDAQWRFSVIDAETGQLLFHSLTRARPTPAPRPPRTPPRPRNPPATAPRLAPAPDPRRPARHSTTPAHTRERQRQRHTRPTARRADAAPDAGPADTSPNARPADAEPAATRPADAGPSRCRARRRRIRTHGSPTRP